MLDVNFCENKILNNDRHLIFIMFQKDYIPTWLTLFLITGIMAGSYISFPVIVTMFCSGILLLVLFLYKKRLQKKLIPPKTYFFISMLLFILIGIISVQIRTRRSDDIKKSLKEQPIIFQIEKILKANNYSLNYEAKILQPEAKVNREKILVKIQKDSSACKTFDVDDIFYTSADLKPVNPPLNPYQFSYKDYLKKRRIFHILNLDSGEFLKLNIRRRTFRGIAHLARKKIIAALVSSGFSTEQLSVINALLLGQRQNIDRELFGHYKNAGAVHILAISGLHVGVLLFLLNFLLKPVERIKNGKLIKLILVIFLLWSFAFLAGLSASVVRAVTMFSAIAIGIYSKRKLSLINALILSMFFLLLFNPFYLFEAGFQLSYLAVFFILTVQPKLINLWHPRSKFLYYFWQLLSVSLTAQLGVLPLSLYYFHRFPGLFLISSLAIIPFLGLILGMGLLIILLSILHVLPDCLARSYGFLIDLMNETITAISQQESFIFSDIHFSFLMMFLMYLSFFLGLNLLQKTNFKNIVVFLIGIILLQTDLIIEKRSVQRSNEFIVFDQYKKMLIGQRRGTKIWVCTNLTDKDVYTSKILNDYKTGLGYLHLEFDQKLQNFWKIQKDRIMLIDSSAIYIRNFSPSIVILSGNPKLNLERLIKNLKPQMIVADHTIFPQLAVQWQKTSEKYHIVFYNTSVQGAFQYKY